MGESRAPRWTGSYDLAAAPVPPRRLGTLGCFGLPPGGFTHVLAAAAGLRHALQWRRGNLVLFWHALDCLATWFGSLTAFSRYVFTFSLACTTGLFWEFAELFSDVFFRTHIQHSIHETMRDLIADMTGALTTLSVLFVLRRAARKSAPQPDQPPASHV